MPQNSLWKAARLLSKCWQDGVVVYNVDSGNTHLLSPVAGQVLSYLSHAPADGASLARQLAAENKLDADAELNYNIDRLLAQLDTLGLIEPSTQ